MASRAGSKTTPPPAPDNRPPAAPDHNQGPLTQADLDDLFLVHLATARADNDLLEKAMETVRGVRKGRTRNRTLCRTDGFPLSELDVILADELLSRHDVEEREDKRIRMRGVAGQPGGNMEQADLFRDSFAQAEKDVAYWSGQGLTAGLRGLDQDPTKHEVPPEHHQIWLTEWHEGQKRLAKAWETKNRIEGVVPPEKPPEPATDETAAPVRPEGTTDEEWEAAAPKPPEDGAEALAGTPENPEGESGAAVEPETQDA